MSSNRSIVAQIQEIERELELRRRAYPRWVQSRGMRQAEADEHMARMEAVLYTLLWLQKNEERIKAHAAPGPGPVI